MPPVVFLRRLLYLVLDIVVLLLVFRLGLRFIGANALSGFAQFIYNVTDVLLSPFRGIFPQTTIEGSVIEWSTILAIIIYCIVAYILVRLLYLLMPPVTHRVVAEEVEEDLHE